MGFVGWFWLVVSGFLCCKDFFHFVFVWFGVAFGFVFFGEVFAFCFFWLVKVTLTTDIFVDVCFCFPWFGRCPIKHL